MVFLSRSLLAADPPVSVPLQNATATYSQVYSGSFLVGDAIDGGFSEQRQLGWAVYPGGIGRNDTAVFETVSDAGFAGGSLVTFTLNQNLYSNPGHTIGRFSLALTEDPRSSFADGRSSGGNVTANWSSLDPVWFTSANGATLTRLADHSILASGFAPGTDVYTVTGYTTLTHITGVRLQVLTDPSLPFGGPGREWNGNFVLTQFTMSIAAAPEPDSAALLGFGAAFAAAGTLVRAKRQTVSRVG